MTLNPDELALIRTAADTLLTIVVSVGLPILGAWAVKKNLIQKRWESMIEAAAGAGLAAGRAAGSVDSPAFRTAAEKAILDYAKSQAPDVLASKGMTDNLTIEAGMARVAANTGGAVGPNGSVAAPTT